MNALFMLVTIISNSIGQVSSLSLIQLISHFFNVFICPFDQLKTIIAVEKRALGDYFSKRVSHLAVVMSSRLFKSYLPNRLVQTVKM